MLLVLDACTLIWYFNGSRQLSRTARNAIDSAAHRLFVPVSVLAELEHRKRRGREAFGIDEVLDYSRQRQEVHLVSTTLEVLRFYPDGFEIHDALCVATALWLQHELPGDAVAVVTSDQQMTDSGIVQVVW